MTTKDDWTRFCGMMREAGWDQEFGGSSPFIHTHGAFYDPLNGSYSANALAKIESIGDWRTWLEAGSTPSPF